jgi:hypothetical protein
MRSRPVICCQIIPANHLAPLKLWLLVPSFCVANFPQLPLQRLSVRISSWRRFVLNEVGGERSVILVNDCLDVFLRGV